MKEENSFNANYLNIVSCKNKSLAKLEMLLMSYHSQWWEKYSDFHYQCTNTTPANSPEFKTLLESKAILVPNTTGRMWLSSWPVDPRVAWFDLWFFPDSWPH